MENQNPNPDPIGPSSSGSNDQLLGALTYPLPIVGIIVLLSDSMKNNPVLRTHAIQSLALGAVLFIVSIILGIIPVVGCLAPLVWLGVTLYYAYQAYQGKPVTIPVVTDFCRNQHWI